MRSPPCKIVLYNFILDNAFEHGSLEEKGLSDAFGFFLNTKNYILYSVIIYFGYYLAMLYYIMFKVYCTKYSPADQWQKGSEINAWIIRRSELCQNLVCSVWIYCSISTSLPHTLLLTHPQMALTAVGQCVVACSSI